MGQNPANAAKRPQANNERHPGSVSFPTVLKSEHATINERRSTKKRHHIQPEFDGSRDPLYDTIGLALSGGGIRSAAFCLGALQALEGAGALNQVDYLSTVSGGGYAGACWSGFAQYADKDGLPFSSVLKAEEPAGLRHIRDHSNYLIPHGVRDVLISSAIYLRGVAANALLVLPWLLLAAAITIALYPTHEDLTRASQASFLPITVSIALALGLFLAVWALFKSVRAKKNSPEIPGIAASVFSFYVVTLLITAFVELQPHILHYLLTKREAATIGVPGASLMVISAGLATVVGLFGNKLTWIVNQITKDSSIWTRLRGVLIKLTFFLAALALPIILWLIYLQLCVWGIATASPAKPDPSAPGWIKTLAGAALAAKSHIAGLISHFIEPTSRVGKLLSNLVTDSSVGLLYLLAFLSLILASFVLAPNANSLHRLYRDRLSNAFLFKKKQPNDQRLDPVAPISDLRLSQLSHKFSPYHLMNAALNIQNSRQANQRGRDADFFLFSANYVGSDSTGYIDTKDIEPEVAALDLGTAMAISGAAAASNMGANLRRWAITLALLNVRLGFWFPNPKFVKRHSPRLSFLRITNLYLLSEMLSLQRENRQFLYLTDGGHIENLGLYQLLRRRCELIIVVDAEADPKMTFNSFIKAERYARIDLGTRIWLPWYEVREATLETSRVIAEKGDTGTLVSRGGPHCALGTIYYPDGQKGILLYIKSSLSGDENDYIIDYKRRYPNFPHETTGDQFFSEEQFEAYRNLGFHATQGFFSGRDEIALTAAADEPEGAVRPESKNLKSRAQELLKYHRPGEFLANVKRR